MKKRRYNATLLEVIIAMVLAATLMAALLGYYWRASRANAFIATQRHEAMTIRYVQQRLTFAIERASLQQNKTPNQSTGKKQKKISCFFSSTYHDHESLIFTFDNGNDSIPELSNTVLARIYLDNGALMMTLWPQPLKTGEPNNSVMKTELLLTDVEDIQFAFFSPPTQESLHNLIPTQTLHEGNSSSEPSPGTWYSRAVVENNTSHTVWEKNFDRLPPLVTLSITMKKPLKSFPKTITFAFQIPASKQAAVTYWNDI